MEQAFLQTSKFCCCFFSFRFAEKMFTISFVTRKYFDLPPIRCHFTRPLSPCKAKWSNFFNRTHIWRSWNQWTRRENIIALSNAAPFGQRFQWRQTTTKIDLFFSFTREICVQFTRTTNAHIHTVHRLTIRRFIFLSRCRRRCCCSILFYSFFFFISCSRTQ